MKDVKHLGLGKVNIREILEIAAGFLGLVFGLASIFIVLYIASPQPQYEQQASYTQRGFTTIDYTATIAFASIAGLGFYEFYSYMMDAVMQVQLSLMPTKA